MSRRANASGLPPPRPLRIVYLHQYFTTPDVAGGTRSYEFAVRLAARGHEVHVVTSDRRPGAGRRREQIGGVTVHWLPVAYDNSMNGSARTRAFLRFAGSSSSVARALRGDLVFATSTPLTIVIPALYAVAGRSTPLVFEVRDLWPELPIAMGHLRSWPARRAAFWLQRLAYGRSRAIIALSPGMRSGIVARGVPPGVVTVVPNACDRALFSGHEKQARAFRDEHGWLGDRPMVLYAGTYGRINDIGWLASVAQATARARPDVRFVTIGSGGEEWRVRQAAADAGVLDVNFFMLPAMAKTDLAAVLAAADLALSLFAPVPEMEANSANKFFDALAAQRPVAVNYGGWHAELLQETGAGLRLSRDPEAASAELVRALSDDTWVRTAREAAGQLAEHRFDRDVLFQEFETVLLSAGRHAAS